MATKKATKTTSSRSSTKKAAPKKAVKKTNTKVTTLKAKASKKPAKTIKLSGNNETANIVLAEFVGTFVLTMVALLSIGEVLPLYVGLTLALLVMSIGAVSGSHVNPAVTFGLWSARKVKGALVPFYWIAQFIGAMAAFVALQIASVSFGGFFEGKGAILSFDHFGSFNMGMFALEMVATAVFLLGIVMVTSRKDFTDGAKAVGVGLSLFVAILLSMGLTNSMQAGADTSNVSQEIDDKGQQKLVGVPHEIRTGGATLNPAIALAVNEKTDSQLRGSKSPAKNEKLYSRLSLEVIFGTLIGAALGGNLALLISRKKD
ncbi:hypothetical protein CR956_00700 [Candidatus Saccharibacteria bacterium]|nr:MAG: hypothetical protein CR956_00700 [Candidatus Saccharibacteria bacterium]